MRCVEVVVVIVCSSMLESLWTKPLLRSPRLTCILRMQIAEGFRLAGC